MAYAHPEYLIEADELRDRRGDPTLRVYDATVKFVRERKSNPAVSGRSDYEAGHIPGAGFLDHFGAFSVASETHMLKLPTSDELAAAMRAIGINRDSEVVVYSTELVMWATRAWWLLHYAGHSNVRVLNGGLEAWRKAGGETVAGSENHPEGDFHGEPRERIFAAKEEVLAAIGDGGICTLNTLTAAMYRGDDSFSYARPGHISGSLNLPWSELLSEEAFRDADSLRDALNEHCALSANRVITYCGGGIAATVGALACLLVGKGDVAVYDGSLSEWSADESLPMTTGHEAG